MNYQIFSDNAWVYPDTAITAANKAMLYAARGGDVCFQVLTDKTLNGGEAFSFTADGLACEPVIYQLLPAHVGENSGAKLFTTTNYEEVKSFVTRKAPFDVYEVTKPLDGGVLDAGRAAFYVRLNVAYDAVPGQYDGSLTLNLGGEALALPVSLKIYHAQIPALKDSSFHMVNWIYYDRIASQYGVEPYSEEFRKILGAYFDNELDMRNDYLMIPAGTPIRDEAGRVVDFDFAHAEYVGNMALEYGFKYIMGGFVARFNQWDKDEQFLLWDREVGVTTVEGYRQLKIYFTRVNEIVEKNGWRPRYMQCLVDEPQFPNSLAYRALSCIFRSRVPGVKVNDPVETTDIAGAVDIWAVKQAVYEKYIDTFRALQDMGEEMWLYTCGFPAGSMMNRILDLPLSVSRLPMWLCYKYNCPGFLHWGYHLHNPEIEKETCYRAGPERRYPAGNSFVVYPGDKSPWYAVRGHSQRTGAEDYELFNLLGQKDHDKAIALIEKVCRGFDDYNPSAELLDEVRHELLEAIG